MSNRFTRLFGRKGTSSKFGQDQEAKKDLPQVKEDKVTISSKDHKGKEKETDTNDDQVDKEHKAEDKDAVTNVQTASTSKKADDGVLKTKEGTKTTGTPSGVYSMLWKTKTDYQMSPIQYSSTAEWIPNLIAFKPMIEECARLVGQANHTAKHNQVFNPYAFATGMYYLSFIQILRAQKAAGTLVGQDASALARFEKYNPLQGIVIPEPFIPFFEAIVATKLEDAKYKWIIPSHGIDFTGGLDLAHLMTPSIEWIIRPNLLFMIMNLTTFGAIRRIDMVNHVDAAHTFTPVDLNRTAGQTTRLLDADLRFDRTAAHAGLATAMENVLQMNGASTSFQFWNDNHLVCHDHMTRSNYFVRNGVTLNGDHLIITNLGNTNRIDGVTRFTETFGNNRIRSLDQYLFIAKENNPAWFKYLTSNINYVSRFFKGSKPFSQIATTGGLESGVICHLKTEQNQAAQNAAQSFVYADLLLGVAHSSQIDYYGNKFADMTASFVTTRADIERNEELNALCIGINANPPINGVVQGNIRKGRFFTDIIGGATFNEMLSIGFTEPGIPGTVPMYSELKDDFVGELFNKKPADI